MQANPELLENNSFNLIVMGQAIKALPYTFPRIIQGLLFEYDELSDSEEEANDGRQLQVGVCLLFIKL